MFDPLSELILMLVIKFIFGMVFFYCISIFAFLITGKSLLYRICKWYEKYNREYSDDNIR